MAWWDDEPWADALAGEDPYYVLTERLHDTGAGWDNPQTVERDLESEDA